jgi:predicted helicase
MSWENEMFDGPSDVYSMDNNALYGKVAYSLSYREAVQKGIVTDMQIHLVHVTDEDVIDALESGDDIILNGDNGEDVVLDTDGKKALAAASIAARKWFSQAIKGGIARKALAFFNRKSDCGRAIDPSHPLALVSDDSVATFEFHSGLTNRARARARKQFDSHKGPALMTSVRAIREGVSIDDADTAILLRGYGSDDDEGASVELIQHVGRVVRLSEDKEFANVVIPIPDTGAASSIRNRVLRLVRDLLESMDIMPELVGVLEEGDSITSGTLREVGIHIHPSQNLSAEALAESVQYEVMRYIENYNRPLYDKISKGLVESKLLQDVVDGWDI